MTDSIKVVLVDDDILLGNMVSSVLTADGYKVHFQNSLTGITNIIHEFDPSILILDVEIGEEDGITTAQQIIEIYPSLPILFISSHIESGTATRGIRTGGVGYVRKPFEMEELEAPIDRFALPGREISGMQIGDNYSLNIQTRELYYQGGKVKQLSPHEFTGLLLLTQNKNEIVSYETLSKRVWGKPYVDTEASMNNLISKIRKLLESDLNIILHTIKNIGYKLTF